jgi:E3 ubiquitin-protein ligase DOA10
MDDINVIRTKLAEVILTRSENEDYNDIYIRINEMAEYVESLINFNFDAAAYVSGAENFTLKEIKELLANRMTLQKNILEISNTKS